MAQVDPAYDQAYWQALNPHLSMDGSMAAAPVALSAEELSGISATFWREGYLHLPPLFREPELDALQQGIEALVDEGWPPAFIYVYDAPYVLFQRLQPLIAYFLGEDYRLLPNLWAWHINQGGDFAGWPPHQDCQAETRFGDVLMSLSLWIPMTEATPENGCMYVLPRPFEADYPEGISDVDQIRLQDVRALPSKRGGVLGWPQDLYHWSGRSSQLAQQPRISLSLEFQNPAFDPLADPLLDPQDRRDFQARLALILQQFEKYSHMEKHPAMAERLPVLRALLQGS